MGKGTNHAYRVVPVDDEPDFGDPPRNWGRVASMAGVWAVLLFGGFLVAPGFASGGGEEETRARDQPATDEINAASRYLRFGSDGDTERAAEVLCDDAVPEVTAAELVDLRVSYEEELGSYPEIEVSTEIPVASADGYEINVTTSYISGEDIRRETFTITVRTSGEGYCVQEVIRHVKNGPGGQEGDMDLDFLRFIVWDRDLGAATNIQCSEYSGPSAKTLLAAVEAWESKYGADGTSYAAPIGTEAHAIPGAVAEFPYEIVMSGGAFKETFDFSVTISGDCVLEVTGGESLLAHAED